MDKRFFLALMLTGIVVVVTPMLFRQPQVAVPPAAVISSEGAPAATSTVTPSPAVATPGPVVSAPGASPPRTANAPTIAAETLSVANDLTTLSFTTRGAAFLGAALPKYRQLGKDSGTVRLEHGSEPMLSYRLIAGGDTIALDTIAFTATRSTADSRPALTFTGAIGAARVVVRYELAPDNYLAAVTWRAEGLAQPTFLLTDLPTGFTSQEADTTEDHRHLAYAMKPLRAGAERVDFRKPDPGERVLQAGPFAWAVAKSKYFLVGVLAADSATSPFAEVQVTGAPRVNKVAVRAAATVVAPLSADGIRFELFAGPQEWQRLVSMGHDFENVNPYGGWISGVVQPFATIVMRVLLWMKRTLDIQYGWILVIFGVAIRMAMWPLNSRMMRSSIQMQRIAPQVQAAQNKHKGDAEKQREADEGVPGGRREPLCGALGLPADAPADADPLRALLRVPEHDRVPRGVVHVACRHLAQGPVLHPATGHGLLDVRSLVGGDAERAAQSADEDDGLPDAGGDDGGAAQLRVRAQPLLRGAEPRGTPAAVADRERAGEEPAGRRGGQVHRWGRAQAALTSAAT
ncbi:MAG: membrane protein insertase YidC [Gemmatimonadota bacterium]|nr:membrane protein insertase YidC [Gemmatimonadota bacterium]